MIGPASRFCDFSSAEQTEAALAADSRLGLIELSQLAGCSPHPISRMFTQLTGSTVSQYRNRRRVTIALQRIGDGEQTSPPSRLNSDSPIIPT